LSGWLTEAQPGNSDDSFIHEGRIREGAAFGVFREGENEK
jgi:hypothetical protein